MSAITDTAYVNAWITLNRVAPLATFDQYTAIGSAFWRLNNHLNIIRGDEMVGGTAVTAAQRAALVGADGELLPATRAWLVDWTAQLNSAFPVTVTTVTNPVPTTVAFPGEPFLGGILDGKIFGIDKKLAVLGLVAFFFLKGK